MTATTPTTEAAMDTERKVDVLEVMGSDAVEAHCERERVFGHKRANEAYAESVAAQEAVAELIEADREFDKAAEAWAAEECDPEPLMYAFYAARHRRNTALSRLGASA